MTPGPAPLVVLVGPPGAGKSTIGRKLARALDTSFDDADLLIEERTGRPIPEIFAESGEARFREIEEELVGDALGGDSAGVLSLGGGAVLSALTRERLRGHRVVHLTLGVAEGVRRAHGSDRPLFAGSDRAAVTVKYQNLLADRAPYYREVAWRTVSTERRSTGRVVREILDHLAEAGVDVPDGPAPESTDSTSTPTPHSREETR